MKLIVFRIFARIIINMPTRIIVIEWFPNRIWKAIDVDNDCIVNCVVIEESTTSFLDSLILYRGSFF